MSHPSQPLVTTLESTTFNYGRGVAIAACVFLVMAIVAAAAAVGGYLVGHKRGADLGARQVWALAIEARVAVHDPITGERRFTPRLDRVDGHSPKAIHDGRTYPPGAWIDPCRKPIGSANP